MRTFLILMSFISISFSAERDTLYILQTTDLHGHIHPYNYFKDTESSGGLAQVSTLVKSYRAKHKNVILLDAGDLIQGTPLVSLFNEKKSDQINPMIATMNVMKYDAFAVGNHDIEQGKEIYDKARTDSDFPWLSANSMLEDASTYFEPYTILNRSGIKIGIIGLTTPGIPMWLDKDLYPGITWTDMVETSQKYAQKLRPEVDVVVGLFHAGLNASYSALQTEALGLPNENASGLVADNVEEFDVVFAGHSHRKAPKPGDKESIQVDHKSSPKVLRMNAGSYGKYLAVTQLVLNKNNDKWTVVKKNGWLDSTEEVEPDSEIINLNNENHKEALAYIRTPIANVQEPLLSEDSRIKDTAIIDLINKSQMNHFDADISFAASFNTRVHIPVGEFKIKDVFALYPYENFLYLIEMTGKQIKDYLEFSAQYYQLKDGVLTFNKEIPGYNYDMAEGIRYQIDISQEKGNQISNVKLIQNGENLVPTKTYKVAMNSYRATGGGGHLAAAGINQATILKKSNMDMRTILIQYLQQNKNIVFETNNSWEVVY